jgi:hypothetical protein
MTEHNTYLEAAQAFLERADWLEESDDPMRFAFIDLARRLDVAYSNPVYGQWRHTWSVLSRRDKPGAPKRAKDPDQELRDLLS